MATTILGTYTGTRGAGAASCKITIAGSTREITSNLGPASDSKVADPVTYAVVNEVLGGATSGTITVTVS